VTLSPFMPPPNTTCDIYRNANAPPNPPDVAGVKIHLVPRFRNIKTTAAGFVYDHIVYLPLATDVRDDFPTSGNGDGLYVPNQNGNVIYTVAFVERVRLDKAGNNDYLRAFAVINQVTWPTSDL
jgi:hypothetical protein